MKFISFNTFSITILRDSVSFYILHNIVIFREVGLYLYVSSLGEYKNKLNVLDGTLQFVISALFDFKFYNACQFLFKQ